MGTMEQKLNEELKQLQREIEVCEAEQDSYVRSISLQHGEALRGVLQTLYNKKEKGDGTLKKDVSKLITDITDTEKDLRRQTNISGITLTECCVKTLEKNERKTIQQYRLTGHCCFLSFQVEFALVDIQDSDSSLQKITDLNVILDGAEFKDLCAFVSRVEETKSLFLFFRTLRLFSERCKQRSCTLQYFKEKYPDVVRLPEGCRSEVMMIQSPKLPGCTMSIFWKISVSKEGVVQPKLELLMKMPEQAQKMDTNNVMETAPEAFRSLLKIFGVEASIESLIKSVCF
ncbi:centromere protein P isoform X2 [Pygocentrus nattereri]|uniref:Centromere protein P n=2 Tax=Pygocentrus nattereri TaxID=42514 RepID=A0A3B4DJ48_PYGNA|nr:centromere protein P isoform X2 [Pygocentrus nattereri]